MESIVVSLLGKYLELFIKDFRREQLNISAMQGKVELKNVELVNDTLQEMLMVPTSLLVTKAMCNELVLQLPKLTEVRKKPLVLSIDRVTVTLEEPDVVPPMPHKLRDFFSSRKKADPSKKKKEKDDIARSANCNVKLLTLSLKLNSNPHPLTIEVRDFALATSTATGQITEDLAAARVQGKDNTETMFKAGSIGSVTVAIGEGADRIVILDGLPAALKMLNTVTFDLGLPVATMFSVIIGKFGIVLDRAQFYRHYRFVKDLNACLDRYVVAPEDNDAEKKIEDRSFDKVDVGLQMEDWVISVLDDKSGDSFGIRGQNLSVGASPPRAVKDATDGTIAAVSSALISMGSMIVEYFPAGGAPSKTLVTSNAPSGSSFEFEAATQRKAGVGPAKVAFKFYLNQLCVLLDRAVIEKLYNVLNLAKDHEELRMDLAALPQKAQEAKEKLKAKMAFSLDELYQAADALVEIQDLRLTIPADATLEDEALRTLGLKVGAKKISLHNTPGWAAVPHVADGKALLLAQQHGHDAGGAGGPPPLARRLEGGAKWQVGIEGFDLSILKDGEQLVRVAEPSDVMLYGRAVKATPPHIEVAIRTTAQKLVVTPQVVAYLTASSHAYSAWLRSLLSLGESKEESKASLADKLVQVREGMAGMEDSVVKRVVDSAAAHDIGAVVNESLSAFTALLYVRFEGGSALYNGASAEFESLQLAAELSGAGQSFVVQLGCVTATNIHNEHMPVVMELHPVRRAKGCSLVSQAAASSSVSIALKRPGKSLGVPTIVELGLNNVAVTSRGLKTLSPVEMLDEITNFTESASTISASTKETLGEVQSAIKLHGKKVLDSLNLHWRFRLGECSFVHNDHDAGSSTLHRGVVTVGAVDWEVLEKRFADLEGQLIAAKMTLVTDEQDKEELRANVRLLQETVMETMKQVEAKSNDFVIVNQKLMEERMKISDLNETIDRLKAQLARGGGPPPINRQNK